MERQRAAARAAWSGSGEAATETLWYALRERTGATEFLGYEAEEAEAVVAALVTGGAEVEALEAARRACSSRPRPRSTASRAVRSAIPASSPGPA